MKLAAGHHSLPRAGEEANGDAVVVRQDGEHALLAVIDALGHGPRAQEVAQRAVSSLREIPLDSSVEDIVAELHRALHASRGISALLCVVRGNRLRGASIGNVALRAAKSRLQVMLTPGILGQRIRRLRVFEGPLLPGDRLVGYTDGVSGRFAIEETRELSPSKACRMILEGHRHPHDDATVLVVDVAGPSAGEPESAPSVKRRTGS